MSDQKFLSLQQIFEKNKPGSDLRGDLFSRSVVSEAARHLCIYEEESPIELPTVVVPADGDYESFFADIATFFPSYAPISAYVHVLNKASFSELREKFERKSSSFSVSRQQLSAYIGLIMGDALSTSRGPNQRAPSLGYSACKRTFAYCVARAGVLYPQLPSEEIATRWLQIRKLSGMDASSSAAISLCWIANFISGNSIQSPNHELSELTVTLSLFLKGKASRQSVAEELTTLYPNLRGKVPLQNEAYEKRIEAFSAIVNSVRQSSKGPGLDSMCVAFFCNLILPGSFAHSGLIEKLLPSMPDGMVWYGLFAGASEEFSLASSAGGVGLKLLRDLCAPLDISQRPTCDISFEEYEVLARIPLRSEILKPTQAKAVLVSLYPGVDVYVRSMIEDDDGDEKHPRANFEFEQNERINQVRHLLAQAELLLSGEGNNSPVVRSRAKTTTRTRQVRG